MELIIDLPPTQKGIQLMDEVMKSYISVNQIPFERELCFVLHELVINAVEAMACAKQPAAPFIRIKLENNDVIFKICVIDFADGIPEEKWEQILVYDFDSMGHLDRGRGLFFVKNMVDDIWFEYVAPQQFLVGVSKKISI